MQVIADLNFVLPPPFQSFSPNNATKYPPFRKYFPQTLFLISTLKKVPAKSFSLQMNIDDPHKFDVEGKHWFKQETKVYPFQTDYSGNVWHGTYLTKFEKSRVDYLQQIGDFKYDDFVNVHRSELVAYKINLTYRRPAKLGDILYVLCRIQTGLEGDEPGHNNNHKRPFRLRIVIENRLVKLTQQGDYVTLIEGDITLAPISADTGKPLRRLPDNFVDAMLKIHDFQK